MGFKENVMNKLQQQNNDREQVDFPSNHLKHKELYFPKTQQGQESAVLIRILPPVDPDAMPFEQMRELFLQTKNRNGKDLKMGAVLSAYPDPEDELNQAIIDWQSRNAVPNLFNRQAKPSTKYLANVVQIVKDANGNLTEEKDQNGELVVRLLRIPFSACQDIMQSLMDDMSRPRGLSGVNEDIAQFSFISSQAAYPIKITKPQKGSTQMSYGVQLYANMEMGPLPQGWENQLEDLTYQATPTMKYNGDYARYFISVVNGNEESFNEARNQGSNTNAGGNQSPVQGQPRPEPNFGRDPQPQGNPVDPTAIDDSDFPYNMQAMPDVLPREQGGGQSQPQPQPQPRPQQQNPNPAGNQGSQQPQQSQQDSGLPDVDALLDGINRQQG